jgi:TIR domain
MNKLWLTYAWKDNEDKDIDFIIQELDKTELKVQFDRRNLVPGQRLWPQIGGIITDPKECNAWGIVLTGNSLKSEACIEELCYALDRALSANGVGFPVFGLLHNISAKDLPPALKIRLCISLREQNWVQQTIAAVKQKPAGFDPSGISEFVANETAFETFRCLEVRPRFDTISPFVVFVDYAEKENDNVQNCRIGPSGAIPTYGTIYWPAPNEGAYKADDGKETRICAFYSDHPASPTTSYYLVYRRKPKWIGCGRWNGRVTLINLWTT